MAQKIPVKDNVNLYRDSESTAIVNKNRTAYELAVKRSREAQRQRDDIRCATREINHLKCEMREIKSLLLKLIENE
tara:strand:+ start:373 stop:600 length:228 start_codon:yes stop_codon:yes gene_type:complete